MRALICSDLHIDAGHRQDPDWYVDPSLFDVAFVLGDISDHAKTSLRYMRKFKEKVLSGKQVFVIAGNHDRWGSLFSSSEYFLKQIPGFINREVVEYEGQRILGCTLWYEPAENAERKDWRDFRYITDWKQIYQEHKLDMKFLDENLQEGDIVLTHVLPTLESISPQWVSDPHNNYYVVEIGALIKERKPKLWCMGHSHEPIIKMVHNTLMLRNPRGYPGELSNFCMWIVDTDRLHEYDSIMGINPYV